MSVERVVAGIVRRKFDQSASSNSRALPIDDVGLVTVSVKRAER